MNHLLKLKKINIYSQFKPIILQPTGSFTVSKPHKYVRGFRNMFAQEIEPGYLPKYTNPKLHTSNLVTELITGPSGFTGEASGGGPLKLWIYKKERSIKVGPYQESGLQPFKNVIYKSAGLNPLRFKPPSIPTKPTNFLEGLIPFGENEHLNYYQYSINQSMSQKQLVFHNVDGEMLIQPSVGGLQILTECGVLEISPGSFGVIPKNMKIQVNLLQDSALGVITELKNDRSFRLPHKGPIGSNGLANSEYFETPTPYVDQQNLNKSHRIYTKKENIFYRAEQNFSPFDVYAWKGNYAPYRFNYDDFVPIIAGNRDHIDPSSHLVLAVGGTDGANLVEFVCFVPRFSVTTDKHPTYQPPWDHRNNGKSEIMHYLGGYDAREGTLPGYQTLHDMGVAHGNDQYTFEKSRYGENKAKFLDFPTATMMEMTGTLKLTSNILQDQDQTYGDQLRGDISQRTSSNRPQEAIIGQSQQITLTAYEKSVVTFFNVLMPNPEIQHNKKTGLTIRKYSNRNKNVITVQSQHDQNRFWDIYKDLETESIEERNPEESTDQELYEACQTTKSFFNRGTVVHSLCMEVNDPLKTSQYYRNQGFFPGHNDKSISIDENSPFAFQFIEKNSLDNVKANDQALVSTIDHTVINIYGKSLPLMFKLLPDTFWGGDPRDLRAPGVQFYTRVLTNDIKNVKQMVPINNLDETEEIILERMQNNDTFLPPYIKEAAYRNQITRGMYDSNRTVPKASKNAFLQHIAMAVNTEIGEVREHLTRLNLEGIKLIPSPPHEYYKLSEIDLAQRVVIPTLFLMHKIDAFQIPYQLFNALLKPQQADCLRLREILLEENCPQEFTENIIKAVNYMIPVFELIANALKDFNPLKFSQNLKDLFKQQGLNHNDDLINTLTSLMEFNRMKLQKAEACGTLIDFQILFNREQSGYLDQTFTIPVSQLTEGTSTLFFEFIVRTCYDDIFGLMKIKSTRDDKTKYQSCGAFGQGNFPNLMIGQQIGIQKIDDKIQQQKLQGQSFQLPLIDLDTIKNDPLQHLKEHILICKNKGASQDKIDKLQKCVGNLEKIINESRKRGIWK